jgi:hypothetical protein
VNKQPNTDNLKPFKAGKDERRNYKGRPKLPDLKAAMAAVLAEEKDGMTALDAVLKALRAKATKGDVRAAQELLDRAFGRAKQSIDHTTAGEAIKPTFNVLTSEAVKEINKLYNE